MAEIPHSQAVKSLDPGCSCDYSVYGSVTPLFPLSDLLLLPQKLVQSEAVCNCVGVHMCV